MVVEDAPGGAFHPSGGFWAACAAPPAPRSVPPGDLRCASPNKKAWGFPSLLKLRISLMVAGARALKFIRATVFIYLYIEREEYMYQRIIRDQGRD